jgi:hypothetical protein
MTALLDAVYLACIWIAGLSIGHEPDHSLGRVCALRAGHRARSGPSRWPILLMVTFTFIGAAAAYRAGAHIAVAMLTDRLPAGTAAPCCAYIVDLLMVVICLFVVVWGTKLCMETMGQTLAELPWMPVGHHLPAAAAGRLLTLVFVLESICWARSTTARWSPSTMRRRPRGGPLTWTPSSCWAALRADADRHAGGLCPGLAALVGALWIDLPLDGVMIQIASGVNKFSLLAIPFFVLAGAIMAEGGMARRLVAFAGVLVGFVRGGLSLVNILASTFFGAISGSSVADTASIGSVLIPEMEKKGYPRDFSTAVTVSGSVQAILIPPSHNAVIYSLAAGGSVSIAALFMAGVLPGLLLGLSLADLCLYVARKRNFPKGERHPAAPGAARSASTRCGA